MQITNLSKNLGDFSLRDITLRIEEGEYFIIVGPTGAGKTILLETIAGIYSPDTGSIEIAGEDISRIDPKERGVAMVYQDYMLFPHLTVEENIGFGLKQRKTDPQSIREEVTKAAEMLHIEHLLDRYPGTLSGGEQQRAAIARAIITRPRLLLLDEPLSALDASTRERLRSELQTLHRELKTTILHITHHFEDIYSLADRVAIMENGRVVQTGTPEEIFQHPASGFVAAFTGMENIFPGQSLSVEGEMQIDLGPGTIRADTGIEGDVYVGIRPEDVVLSRETVSGGAVNTFTGTITEIRQNGMFSRVMVDTGIRFICALTPQYILRMGLAEGDTVSLTLPESAIHIFPREGDLTSWHCSHSGCGKKCGKCAAKSQNNLHGLL